MALSRKVNADLSNETQQGIRITGTVSDDSGETLPGVSIMIRGTTTGTASDSNGEFSIIVPSDTSVLQFSFIGYQPENIVVGKRRILAVAMKEVVAEIGEVTVVAFATQKKESIVSSIATVNPSELKVPSSNLTTAFAGKIAGVIAYQRSGEPGQDNADFFIRGVTTFGTGKADPLILIDNVELSSSDLSRLSPDDIASFSILKDAAATALYGARGANGVILVTTKEGREGKVSVSFRFENSLSAPVKNIEISDPLTFMKLHNESVRTRDPLASIPYSDSSIAAREEGRNPYVYPMIDWKDMLFKDYTMNQRANMSLSGGGKVARYYVALSYNRDNGILSVDPVNSFNNNIQLNKYSVRSNVNLNLTKTTELAVRVSGTFDDYQGPITSGADMYNNVLKANPVLFPATFAPDETNKYNDHILFGN
ncbi:MAG: SusC/RagA family TonB-linked outer membrane protein, partial [Bacteroidales bacterium]|nr:SusC/RagA family TonB-linked outer membrane protein [Bacteroidales bacterium]